MREMMQIIKLVDARERFHFWAAFTFALLTSLITVGIGIGFGTVAARFVDLLEKRQASSSVMWVLFWISVAYLVNAGIGYLQERSVDTFKVNSQRKLRVVGYDHLQKLSINFYEKNRPGSLVQRANGAMVSAVNWLADFVDGRIYSISIPLFSVVALFKYHWVIGTMALMGLVLITLINIRKIKIREPFLRRGNLAWEEAIGHYVENVSHIATVKTSTVPQKIRENFLRDLDKQKAFRLKQNKVEWKFNSLQLTLEGVTICIIMAATIILAVKGFLGVAALVATMRLIQNSMANGRNIGGLLQTYRDASVEAERFTTLLDEPVDHLEKRSQKPLKQIDSVEFANVSFTYPYSTKEVLTDLSFAFNKNNAKKIAFVGESGGGKSTISKLLLRLYEPTGGEIYINGKPIDTYTPQSIRNCIGTVMQDVALFHSSISDNVLLAKPNASVKEIKKALKIAHADFVDSLSDGIRTIIGERGVKLSGGQRQRIAIARAAIRQPSFILLDEATSALDSISEKEVQAGLDELIKGKNSIVIAHRLSTIRDADEIIVLNKGVIAERGTHTELLETKGAYAKLWSHQSDSY